MASRDRTELEILKTYGGPKSKNNTNNYDQFSRNFAEDLLKGAIDLQESLNMLESFQKCVNKKKRKPQNGDEIQVGSVEGYNRKRFIFKGPSKNNLEGLRKVIKESFQKQNIIMDSLEDEYASSSRSFKGINDSGNNNNNSRGIVAKLMGLGEVRMDLEYYKSSQKDANMKNLSSSRAFFNLDKMSRVRTKKLIEEEIDPNRKALEEIMETMQFKGLMINTILVKDEDQSAKLTSTNGNLRKKGVKRKEVKSKVEAYINGTSNLVRKPSVERIPESSIKKKIEEKKGLRANLAPSISVQKIVSTSSSHAANRVLSNSNFSVKEKSNATIKKTRCSNANVVDKRIKREGNVTTIKTQKINPSIFVPNERTPQKRKPEIKPSIEGDDWSVSFEEEEEEEEYIDFSPKQETNIRLLLLEDKSFVKLANELGSEENKIEDLELYLDVSEEQISRKSLNFELFYPPYETRGMKTFFNVEKSIWLVMNGIMKLHEYANLEGNNNKLKDDVYLKLERDLNCRDEGINSIWDLGWFDWICVEEASNVVCDFSEFILSLLIEEVSFDLFM